MWSEQVDGILKGWTLCNRNNGMPELRSRFIVGAGPGGSIGFEPRTRGEPDKLPPISCTTSN